MEPPSVVCRAAAKTRAVDDSAAATLLQHLERKRLLLARVGGVGNFCRTDFMILEREARKEPDLFIGAILKFVWLPMSD